MFRKYGDGFRDLLTNITFVRLFTGRVITDIGDSLYYIGSMWLVWELTGSPLFTGLAGALVQVPNALRFLVGPLVDRWRLRRILLGTQLINGVGVLIVPLAALQGWLSVWVVLVLMPVLNFVNNFVYPAQNAALPQIVDDELLPQANSLFSTSIQTVDTVANAAAGAIIAAIGAIALFVVDAITFAIAALLFAGVTVTTMTRDVDASGDMGDSDETTDANGSSGGYLVELREGITYIRGSSLMALLLGVMVQNIAMVGVEAVLPAFADSINGPAAYGVLVAAIGAGNLVGTGSAFLVEDYSPSWVTIVGSPLSGMLWLLAVAIPGVWPTAGLLFAAAIPSGIFNVLFFSMVQSAVDDQYLGRVTSLITSFAMATSPVGALLGGSIATVIGSEMMLYAAGGMTIAFGGYFLAHPGLRSLPPVAEADETALGLHSKAG